MQGYSFRSLTDLVLKIFKTKITAGTGLSGGGSLEADRTLTVNYGTAAGTAAQGNDSRIVNAVPNTRTITAGTGLTGGGTLDANRTLTITYGTAAGTAAQGNDSRITGALQSSQVVQVTGTSTTSVMSQKAATDQLATKAASSHTHPWSQVTGQPAQATRWPTFAEVTGKPANYPTTWASVAAQPATATRWPTWTEVTSKPTTFAPSSHTHPVSQVTGLGTAATRNVGTAVGSVYIIGEALGLTSATNLNSLATPSHVGEYRWGGSVPVNAPSGASYAYLRITTWGDGAQQHILDSSGVSHFRSKSNAATNWTAWVTYYHTGNMPATATRWPTLAEVTGKPTNYPTTWASVAAQPATATRWPTFAEVTGKPATYTPTAHTHTWAQVTGIPIVQAAGTSTTSFMSQKAVTDLLAVKTNIATQAQVDAGTDDITAVSPKKLRWGFSITKAENGRIVFPSWMGGLIIQWGKLTSASASTSNLTFPLAFPSAAVFATTTSVSVGENGSPNGLLALTRTYATIKYRSLPTTALPQYWIALGY